MIIQLVVPSASGTNAGVSILGEASKAEFTRVDPRTQGFSWDKIFSKLEKRPHPLLRCVALSWDTSISEKISGEKTAYQHRFGNAAHREYVSPGA